MKKIITLIFLFLSVYVFSQDNTSDTNNINKNKQKNGYELFIEGRYLESIKSLQNEKQYFPNRINIYVILGWDYDKLRNYSEMEKISLEGMKIDPTDARVIQNLAESYFYQKKYNDAINAFEKYLALKYNKYDAYIFKAYNYLGICFYNLDLYNKADIALSTSNYFKQNNPTTLLYMAYVKEKLLNKEKAKEYFSDVLKLDPENVDAKEGLQRLSEK